MAKQPKSSWLTILGIANWNEKTNSISVTHSPGKDKDGRSEFNNSFGLIISDGILRQGVMSANIQCTLPTPSNQNAVEDAHPPMPGSSVQFVIAYDPGTQEVMAAGVSGEGRAIISTFGRRDDRTHGWRDIASTSLSGILEKSEYKLQCEVIGSSVLISIDGVTVLAKRLEHQLPSLQAGLFLQTPTSVTASSIQIESKQETAFVVMEFSEKYNVLYEEVVKPCLLEAGYQPVRADEINTSTPIIDDIIKLIDTATLIVAEVSPDNPNVFYEIGYASALNKPMILIADKGRGLPFDIRHTRVLLYEDSIRGKTAVESKLKDYLDAIRASPILQN